MVGGNSGGTLGKQDQNIDLYEGFADRYDLFNAPLGETKAAKETFFQELFTEHQVHEVLDCACGTGTDLLLLNSLGYEVKGADISESMLAQARNTLVEQKVDIPLLKADYRNLPHHFGSQFDAVICLSSAIFHMPNDGQALKAFQSMRNVLRDGGVLVLSQGTTDKQWNEKPRFILAADTPEVSRIFIIDYVDPAKRRARYNVVDVFHKQGSNPLKVWSTDYYILLKRDYEKLLREAGFSAVDFFGSYSLEPYNESASSRLIVVAQR